MPAPNICLTCKGTDFYYPHQRKGYGYACFRVRLFSLVVQIIRLVPGSEEGSRPLSLIFGLAYENRDACSAQFFRMRLTGRAPSRPHAGIGWQEKHLALGFSSPTSGSPLPPTSPRS
jgi:hypothetical protein